MLSTVTLYNTWTFLRVNVLAVDLFRLWNFSQLFSVSATGAISVMFHYE
jgi:hypothetical protein